MCLCTYLCFVDVCVHMCQTEIYIFACMKMSVHVQCVKSVILSPTHRACIIIC